MGHAKDAETTQLQRFLIRNSYPHRIVETTHQERPRPTMTCPIMNPRCRQ